MQAAWVKPMQTRLADKTDKEKRISMETLSQKNQDSALRI
jgi:hypothetical protein